MGAVETVLWFPRSLWARCPSEQSRARRPQLRQLPQPHAANLRQNPCVLNPFTFLQAEWPDVFDAASRAASAAHPDPRTACFYARRALELAVAWAYKHDASLKLPYQDNLSALIHDPSFKAVAGAAVFAKARLITQLGNQAVHSQKPIQPHDAVVAVTELFHVGYWLAHTYARKDRPAPDLAFDASRLPKTRPVPKQTQEELQRLSAELRERDEKLSALLANNAALDEELKRVRAEVASAKAASAAQPDTHDYSEAETRNHLIDQLLKEAGWPLDQPRDREFEVSGMPKSKDSGSGLGYVDYVLWGRDGKPLGLVEAKRTKRDPRVGEQQAKLYADCLERQFGQRPVIFYSNGYDHWIWDDQRYPPRSVQGFYKPAELERLIQRRQSRQLLAAAKVNHAIVERPYQERAIRRVAEAFEQQHERKALVVMATGAGKTRTVIALCDLLTRCHWAMRVLFLADRVALVNQAVNAFKKHLPDLPPVNLVTDKDAAGRVFVSTYPTMMGLIEQAREGDERRFGVGHFDLIIIDEAHRSIFQKYRAIFDYFDSLLVGLTATPRDEIDRNTYKLFDMEDGVPTDAYALDEAVKDGYLVPPKAISVPLKFQREGIKYADLSEEDKDRWDALDWDDENGPPPQVDPAAVNKWLFNEDTVDKVLAHLMQRGIKVKGGDVLGKTIVFAKNQEHAQFIADRFNVNYPRYRGEFARVITFKTEYAQSLIDAFSQKDKAPHIAISVDMLDTGIDVPEVVNLVFFKLVRSKTKFWQMVGRGTRLCPDLFGPGQHKTCFHLFDYCQNLEYFGQNPGAEEGSAGQSLGTQLFVQRLELIAELDERLKANGAGRPRERDGSYLEPLSDAELRIDLADGLREEVAAMNVENFIVRPKRRLVERYREPVAWATLGASDRHELATEIAGLPSELDPQREEAKRFDLLILRLQLSMLRNEPRFESLRDEVRGLVSRLEEKATIPMVQAQIAFIHEIQSDEWWQDATVPMVESVRRRIRDLVQFIEKRHQKIIYTDFEDEMGPETVVHLPGLGGAVGDFEKFREKARRFLRDHQDHVAVHKLRMARPLNPADLAELERMLGEAGAGGSAEDVARAAAEAKGLGVFVRSLVGLDREAAKLALAGFMAGKTLSSSQIEFVDLVVNHLTEHGVMDVTRLYEPPFTYVTSTGPEAIFSATEIDQLVAAIEHIAATARAA